MNQDRIERRIILRVTGEEADYLIDLLRGKCDWEGLGPLIAKLESAMGRADRLVKVLKEKPAKTLADWEKEHGRG